MNIKSLIIFLCLPLAIFAALTPAQAKQTQTLFVPFEVPGESSLDNIPPKVQNFTLKQIANRGELNLHGNDSSDTLTLGTRHDELIVKAILHLRYVFSPALIPSESHLKISVNDEIVAVLPVGKENIGQSITQDVTINPLLFTDLTNIKFQFIGHYSHECEDPSHSSLWMQISGSSQLELSTIPLVLNNDLALLPEPFFNKRNFNKQVVVPFVFSEEPKKDTLNAAGIISSWFGELAAWRGTRFPVSLKTLPEGNAIVFVSNEDRPDFLYHYPKIEGPALAMMTSPVDHHSKLLLILGRNGADQKIAAQALVLSNTALSGSRATIENIRQELPRKPYDAPNWVHLDRPMKFGEMVTSAQDLQVAGYSPPPIRIPFRVPPDLFTWRSRGVPIDLKYRYTPPLAVSESRLRMSVNEELVKSLILLPSGKVAKDRIRLPLIDDMIFGKSQELLLPSFKLSSRNELLFQFSTAAQKVGVCRGFFSENVRDMIDADSTIDFSGFPHYAEMPNLGYFASAGFPFTKYADLSQTVVVLAEHPNMYDIEVMLALMGRMGESTGYPATQFSVAHANESERLKNVDLLVIGNALHEGVLKSWSDKLPVAVRNGSLRNSEPNSNRNSVFDWLNMDFISKPAPIALQQINQNGSLAVMQGFESPLSNKRSVVAVVSSQAKDITLTLDALDRMNSDFHGSVAFIHPNKIESVLVGNTYTIGNLPFWLSIWYPLASHPILLGIFAVLAVLVFTFALWRTLRVLAGKRLKTED